MPFDICYHQGCDNLLNLSTRGLDQMSDAAAHATITLAQATSLPAAGRGGGERSGAEPRPASTRWRCTASSGRPPRLGELDRTHTRDRPVPGTGRSQRVRC